MAQSTVTRNAGQTTALSVTASATTAVQIVGNTNDQINFVSLLNTGSAAVAVNFGQTSSMGAPVLPTAGTPGDFVLPPLMTMPIILACPTAPFYIRAIGAAAGPSLVYVTPAADQS